MILRDRNRWIGFLARWHPQHNNSDWLEIFYDGSTHPSAVMSFEHIEECSTCKLKAGSASDHAVPHMHLRLEHLSVARQTMVSCQRRKDVLLGGLAIHCSTMSWRTRVYLLLLKTTLRRLNSMTDPRSEDVR